MGSQQYIAPLFLKHSNLDTEIWFKKALHWQIHHFSSITDKKQHCLPPPISIE